MLVIVSHSQGVFFKMGFRFIFGCNQLESFEVHSTSRIPLVDTIPAVLAGSALLVAMMIFSRSKGHPELRNLKKGNMLELFLGLK